MDNYLDIAAYYREDETVWCLARQDAYLYQIDCIRNIIDQVVPLTDEVYQVMAFTAILPYGDCFVFVPGSASTVVIVDRNDYSRECWQVPTEGKRIGSSSIKFFNGLIYKDCLYMFGYSFPGILKMDLKTKVFQNINNWLEKDGGSFTNEVDGCFNVRFCRQEDIIYFPFMNRNAVLIFDLKTENARIQEVGDASQRYTSIEHIEDYFWLIPRDGSVGSIVRWKPDKEDVQYYNCYPKEFNYNKYAFYTTVKLGNKIYLFSHASNVNICFDTAKGEMETFEELYDTSNIKSGKYICAETEGDRIFLIAKEYYIWWTPSLGERKKVAFGLGDKIRCRLTQKQEKEKLEELKRFLGQRSGKYIIQEDTNVDLKVLLAYIKSE